MYKSFPLTCDWSFPVRIPDSGIEIVFQSTECNFRTLQPEIVAGWLQNVFDSGFRNSIRKTPVACLRNRFVVKTYWGGDFFFWKFLAGNFHRGVSVSNATYPTWDLQVFFTLILGLFYAYTRSLFWPLLTLTRGVSVSNATHPTWDLQMERRFVHSPQTLNLKPWTRLERMFAQNP